MDFGVLFLVRRYLKVDLGVSNESKQWIPRPHPYVLSELDGIWCTKRGVGLRFLPFACLDSRKGRESDLG